MPYSHQGRSARPGDSGGELIPIAASWCFSWALLLASASWAQGHLDHERPRLGFPSPPRFETRADARTVEVTWAGTTVQIVTAVRGGDHVWDRQLITHPTHVEVRDTIRNPGTEVIGLHIRYALPARGDTWVGGRPAPDGADAYNPWNPTVFVPVGSGGVGLVAEDDVLRNQLYVDHDIKSRTAGLRTDMLCLAPGDSVTLAWSTYPTKRPSYWDFINTVRVDWGVNRTVPGSYIWFSPEDILAADPKSLRVALERQKVGIASLHGGWRTKQSAERPQPIAYGTYVASREFADYRTTLREAIARLKSARPGLRVLPYFNVQRDSHPDAPSRFPDSALVLPNGALHFIDFDGRFWKAWSMVPTATNSFGRAISDIVPEMRSLGGDGLYWDCIHTVDYARPRLTRTEWDGRSCQLGPSGEVKLRVGLANLLSDAVKLEYARAAGYVFANGPPTTRSFREIDIPYMVEAQHNDTWGAFAHLSQPVGYTSARRDWEIVLKKIAEGLLIAGIPLDLPHEIVARLYPFTPEYIQSGTLRGAERIVTIQSGIHGWRDHWGAVRMLRYDANGREHAAGWRTKARGGGFYVRVGLAPGEAAVIEKAPAPLSQGH